MLPSLLDCCFMYQASPWNYYSIPCRRKFSPGEIFANFTTCCHWRNFLSTNLLSRINDYIEKYGDLYQNLFHWIFLQCKGILGLTKFLSSENFHLYSINISPHSSQGYRYVCWWLYHCMIHNYGFAWVCAGMAPLWFDCMVYACICKPPNLCWYDSCAHCKYCNDIILYFIVLSRPFFDMCDGIFLNYNWNEQVLASSRALASDRSCDVYVGIDVFGRGCYGGGGFNSCKVRMIRVMKYTLLRLRCVWHAHQVYIFVGCGLSGLYYSSLVTGPWLLWGKVSGYFWVFSWFLHA